MDTNPISLVENSTPEFSPGTTVIYGLHGRCKVSRVETRMIEGLATPFYRLEIQKLGIIRNSAQSNKPDPAIWVPLHTAKALGLRLPVSSQETQMVFSLLASKEYYFSLHEEWSSIQPKLETTIRNEGCIGLAKVVSYLFTLKKKQIVPTPEVIKMYDHISKLLYRELSEALGGETIRSLDERITKSMRPKLTLDH